MKCFGGCRQKRFEVKTHVVSAPDGRDKSGEGAASPPGSEPTIKNGEPSAEGTEGRLLNRVARCTAQGWQVELDQRHADLIVQAVLRRKHFTKRLSSMEELMHCNANLIWNAIGEVITPRPDMHDLISPLVRFASQSWL